MDEEEADGEGVRGELLEDEGGEGRRPQASDQARVPHGQAVTIRGERSDPAVRGDGGVGVSFQAQDKELAAHSELQ